MPILKSIYMHNFTNILPSSLGIKRSNISDFSHNEGDDDNNNNSDNREIKEHIGLYLALILKE